MDISIHGHLRVYDRTKMRPEDVLTLIHNDCAVSLGFGNGYEFLLFYSPNDRWGKVAIVPPDHKTIVSVWETDYSFPSGVLRPNKKMVDKAKKKLSRFVFKNSAKENQKSCSAIFAQIQVILNHKIEYTHKNIPIPKVETRKTLKDVIIFLREDLQKISSVVEEYISPTDNLKYEVKFLDQESLTPIRSSDTFKHKTLIKFLSSI